MVSACALCTVADTMLQTEVHMERCRQRCQMRTIAHTCIQRTLSCPCRAQALSDGSAEAALRWLLHPCTPQHFRSHILDQGVLYVPRNGAAPEHNSGCFSVDDVWRALDQQELRYGTQVDVTTFDSQRQRQTYNYNAGAVPQCAQAGQEVANAAVVRRRYAGGASVRLLHPQHYHDATWRLLAALEAAFQCPMGCNVYLTPPRSQVRAPHARCALASRCAGR